MKGASASAAMAAAFAAAALAAARRRAAGRGGAALAAAGTCAAGSGRHAGTRLAVEAEAAFAARAGALAADAAGLLAAGVAAGLADEVREGDSAPHTGITHKDVPPKKMSWIRRPMTSYDAMRAVVPLGARLVSGRDRRLRVRVRGRAAYRRNLRVAQLMRRVGIFLPHKNHPGDSMLRRGAPYSDSFSGGFFASSAISEKRAVTRP